MDRGLAKLIINRFSQFCEDVYVSRYNWFCTRDFKAPLPEYKCTMLPLHHPARLPAYCNTETCLLCSRKGHHITFCQGHRILQRSAFGNSCVWFVGCTDQTTSCKPRNRWLDTDGSKARSFRFASRPLPASSPQEATSLKADSLPRNFLFGTSTKICRNILFFVEIEQRKRTLYVKIYVYLCNSCL